MRFMNDELSKQLELNEKTSTEDYIKAKNILKGLFKTLYDNAGMEWTEDKDNDVEFVADAIERRAINHFGDIYIKFLAEESEKECNCGE